MTQTTRALAGARPAAMGVAVAAALLTQAGCAKSQESKVRDAIAARFPDGPRRCLPLPADAVGIDVRPPDGAVLWYPPDGPTSPTRHAFVLYAAPEDAPVPELVAELTRQGMATRAVVEANTDLQSQRMAPVSHETVHSHERGTLRVAIYETAPWSPDFDYVTVEAAAVGPSFPSRTYDTPLPPDGRYTVPLTRPYVISTVGAACLAETVDQVSGIETKTPPIGKNLTKGWSGRPDKTGTDGAALAGPEGCGVDPQPEGGVVRLA